ncbi:MAG: class I SAM-dependent methyltransferase family protein [Candidatus Thermoplasmatota archaeon]|nr:class I SAM-dependent methyltransferase family protein [Candidatus Thermoplasmatota archaeon]
MKCLKVPKKEGEEVRNKLLEEDLLYKKGKISSSDDDQGLFLPLKDIGEKELEKFKEMGYEVVEKEVEERERIERNYEDLVDIPEELKTYLPSSYDIVGDIALIKLPEELGSYKGNIGEAILETHKNLETVLEDRGVHGKFRIREVRHIAGKEKTVTVYREHGAEFEIDVSEVYFSPRLATERWRVVKKVKEDETVFDMFAGAGPYTVLIGREVDVDHIYSVDLNPKAVKFLMKNVERNDLGTKVTTYEGDARKIAERLKVDRIIMNLPHSSEEFIRPALKALDDKGMIHYYEIGEESEKEERLQKLLSEIREENLEVDVKEEREVRTYSATQVQMAYDLYLEKT